MPLLNWNETTRARRLIAALDPAGVSLIVDTPAVGPRYYIWASASDEALYALRKAHVDALFGMSFAEAQCRDLVPEYLACDDQQRTVSEALASRFGEPGRFGCPPQRCIDGDGSGPERWRRERETVAWDQAKRRAA